MHSINTRHKLDLHVPNAEVTSCQKAVYCAGTNVAQCCSIWHKILNCYIKVFKTAIKGYLVVHSYHSVGSFFFTCRLTNTFVFCQCNMVFLQNYCKQLFKPHVSCLYCIVLHCMKLWHVLHPHTLKGPVECKFFSFLFYPILFYSILSRLLSVSLLEDGDRTNFWNMFLECCAWTIQWTKPQRFRASGFLMSCQLSLLDIEDQGTTVLPNLSSCLPVSMVQHPRSLESSETCCEDLKSLTKSYWTALVIIWVSGQAFVNLGMNVCVS
jgi:hypothetical protein